MDDNTALVIMFVTVLLIPALYNLIDNLNKYNRKQVSNGCQPSNFNILSDGGTACTHRGFNRKL